MSRLPRFNRDLTLEEAMGQFYFARDHLIRTSDKAAFNDLVSANSRWIAVIERIDEEYGGVPREYLAIYEQAALDGMRLLEAMHKKDGKDLSNYMARMRLSRGYLKKIKTF
ncbi:hypothetical protein GF386_03285 [Candidatus Pacearchaeota archaeon]|nr:hypothetical protein [Candidatus Pacearchaeota archaeon]MBD3283163.1 hypothetical protein [Candidatus Pacearchaeota archaeon]